MTIETSIGFGLSLPVRIGGDISSITADFGLSALVAEGYQPNAITVGLGFGADVAVGMHVNKLDVSLGLGLTVTAPHHIECVVAAGFGFSCDVGVLVSKGISINCAFGLGLDGTAQVLDSNSITANFGLALSATSVAPGLQNITSVDVDFGIGAGIILRIESGIESSDCSLPSYSSSRWS